MCWMQIILFALAVTHIDAKYGSACNTTDQEPGVCVPVKSCKTVYDVLLRIIKSREIVPEEERIKLASMVCGTYQNVPHVCCPQAETQLNPDGLAILKRTRCGIFFVDRIAHGFAAPLFQYPWMALIMYQDKYNSFKCAGTLISDQYVLTAAHCIKSHENSIMSVRLGEYQISTDIDCTNFTLKNECAQPVEDIGIEQLIVHEDFGNIYNDIALIKLERKVEFKRHIQPICLPIYDNLRSKVYENYLITGWGRTENGSLSDVLQTAFVPFVNRTDCENLLREYNLRNFLDSGHICAGGVDLVDSCLGDSGGPLGYRDFYSGRTRFVQFGIISFGLRRCGTVNVPAIYTNISYHLQWITDNLKETTAVKHIITTRNVQGERIRQGLLS